ACGKRSSFVLVNQNIYLAKDNDNLPIPKEVNRKKNEDSEALLLAPANGCGHHFTKIDYLSSF
uniref:Protein p311 n=1 Tax=Salvator merianae TaxID=96440 RepID=A0A8D0B6V1_SALMN